MRQPAPSRAAALPRAATLEGYRGHVDQVGPVIAGWVSAVGRPQLPVQFMVAIDREWRFPVIAERARPDVAAAGLAPSACGFALALPARFLDGSEHVIELLLPNGCRLDLPGLPEPCIPGPVRIELIAAGTAGLGAVLELLRRTDREAGFDPSQVTPANAAAFDAIGSPQQGFLYYARAGERLVGYGRLDRGRIGAAGLGIIALTVLEAYRRRGIGEALLRALLAAAAGLQQVWLSVRPDNAPAIRLYDKLGFVSEANHPPGPWAIPGELTMLWTPR